MAPFQAHDITIEIDRNPKAAKRRIQKLLAKHKKLDDVAEELGVSYRSLHRYMTKLGLRKRTP